MKLELELSYDTFEDTIITALEGGSNYWMDYEVKKGIPKRDEMPDKAPSERIAYGLWHNKDSEVAIWDAEEEGELLGTLTYDSVREGMQLACKEYAVDVNEETESFITHDTEINYHIKYGRRICTEVGHLK